MKFNKGDYIRYTKENEQQVIDGLMSMGYEVYAHDSLNPSYEVFALKESKSFVKNNRVEFVRAIKNNHIRLGVDRTKEFFSHLHTEKTIKILPESLPPKFYIDCGDRIEVREWLSDMGFKWVSGTSIIKNVYNLKKIYVKLEEKTCFSMVDGEKGIHS